LIARPSSAPISLLVIPRASKRRIACSPCVSGSRAIHSSTSVCPPHCLWPVPCPRTRGAARGRCAPHHLPPVVQLVVLARNTRRAWESTGPLIDDLGGVYLGSRPQPTSTIPLRLTTRIGCENDVFEVPSGDRTNLAPRNRRAWAFVLRARNDAGFLSSRDDDSCHRHPAYLRDASNVGKTIMSAVWRVPTPSLVTGGGHRSQLRPRDSAQCVSVPRATPPIGC
jgi:hypothetical protein